MIKHDFWILTFLEIYQNISILYGINYINNSKNTLHKIYVVYNITSTVMCYKYQKKIYI